MTDWMVPIVFAVFKATFLLVFFGIAMRYWMGLWQYSALVGCLTLIYRLWDLLGDSNFSNAIMIISMLASVVALVVIPAVKENHRRLAEKIQGPHKRNRQAGAK